MAVELVPQTPWRRFLGMNIKGTPAMPAVAVAHDLGLGRSRSSVLVLQEFKWPWYWRTLGRIVPALSAQRWRSSPTATGGLAFPVRGAQAVTWRGQEWRRRRTRRRLLHKGVANISEDRHLRAVLLEDRNTELRAWFGTTHFVVRGDQEADPIRRRDLMARDLVALDRFLTELVASGEPVLFQLDANLRPRSGVYRRFCRILRTHGATIHGAHGVEFLFTIDGTRTRVEVKDDWIVPTHELRTDHEGRGITFRLVARQA